MSYQYDSYDRKIRVTLPEGNYTTFTYDARGNVTETRAVAKSGSGLADIVTTATYPSTCTNTLTCNKPTSVTDARGKVTDYTYDATHGGVLTETLPDPDGAGPLARPQTRFAYTAKQAKYQLGANNWITGGSIYMLTGTSTCATGTTCNGTGDETLATNAYRASTVANNIELLSTTIAAGDGSITATTAYAYDEIGNLSAVDGPLAGTVDTTAFFYDNVRRPTGVVSPDPDGAGALKFRASRTTYNARGRPSVVEGGTVTAQTASAFAAFASLSKTTSAYDIYGRKSEARVYDGATTLAVRQFNYDVLSRLDCSARRMNPAVFSSLPSSACVLGTTGSEGEDRITRTTYDVGGQVLKTISAYGTSLQQDTRTRTYSSNGQVATRKDANGNKTTYEYDGFDRLSKLRFPSKTTAGTSSTTDYETYGYDANGNVTSERRRDGQLAAITYDDLSRRSFRDAPGTASDVTYAYDNRGLQTAASVPGHASAYAFDAFGRRTQQTHDGAMPVSYAYDAASRLTKLTHPDGFAVDYAYDAAGAVISAANGATTIATVAYDDQGRRSALTYGNGAVAAYGYDAASRLDALDWDVAGSADDIAYGFSYNPASQTRTKNVAPAVMLWTPPSNATDTYAVNGLNQYTDVKGNTIVHDGRGNITTDHRGRTQTYDIDNRLLTVAGLAGGTATYAYTAAGNLHQKSYSGVASKFYYDDTQEIYETDGVGVKLRRYLRLPGGIDEPLLMIDYTLNGACTNSSYAACEVWAHQNRLGSIVATTNSAGAKLDIYTYSPYGESGTEGASGFPFRYTGQKLDPDTGLYYYKARWYDPEPGRFMQTDPIGYEDQMNLYAYVGNDPVNKFDPEGRVQRDADGRIKFDPDDDPNAPGYVAGSDGSLQPVQFGTIYADDGTPIQAIRNNSDDRGLDCNCHGFSFGDGEFWIDPSQVDALLEGDGYNQVDSPEAGDVAIYRDSSGNAVHSALVTGVDAKTGEVTVEGVDGRSDVPVSSSAGGQGYGDDPEFYRQ